MSTTTAAYPGRAAAEPRRTYRIPVSTGIFDHYLEIGDALWLLLFYIDRTTEERPAPNGKLTGIVLGGRPVRDKEAAAEFGCKVNTIRRWRKRLEWHGIIRTRRTPFGPVVEVANSQKWNPKKQEGSDRAAVLETHRPVLESRKGVRAPHRPILRIGEGCARNAQYKEDKTGIYSTRHRQQSAAKAAFQTFPTRPGGQPRPAGSPAAPFHSSPASSSAASQPRVPGEQEYPLTMEENLKRLREACKLILDKHSLK